MVDAVAGGDFTKYDYVYETNLRVFFNQLSFMKYQQQQREKEYREQQRKAGNNIRKIA